LNTECLYFTRRNVPAVDSNAVYAVVAAHLVYPEDWRGGAGRFRSMLTKPLGDAAAILFVGAASIASQFSCRFGCTGNLENSIGTALDVSAESR
jgi:hypothetical protein